MTIYHGDCLEIMGTLPDDSIDLIFTSPPYAMQRKKQYGGIPEDEYVDWWMPRAAEMKRILKPTGSLVVNIKEHVKDGQRSLYVGDMKSAMVRQGGWLWIEEYIWRKSNSANGYWPTRVRDGWEHCYHFAKTIKPKFKHLGNGRAPKQSTIQSGLRPHPRRGSVSDNGYRHTDKTYGPGDLVQPDNVIELNTEQTQRSNHPAPFPIELPMWFIRQMTDHGDTVLDPFVGGGTTVHAARKLNRVGIGIEIDDKYITGGDMEAYLEQ